MAAGKKKQGGNAAPRARRKPLARRKAVAPAKSGEAAFKQQLAEAREQQAAMASILKVIASSPSDVQPVFDAIARSAVRLINGYSSSVGRIVGDQVHLAAYTSTGEAGDAAVRAVFPRPVGEGVIGKAVATRSPAISADMEADPEIPRALREMARKRGHRSIVSVPMLLQGTPIGTISVTRREAGAFTDHQIALLKTFADQAVIAIENVRLFNETKEALERQTATAEILKVIASSPADVQPVFDAIVETAKRLIGAFSATVTRVGEGKLHLVAHTATTPAGAEALKKYFPIPVEGTPMGRAVLSRRPAFIDDFEADTDDARDGRELARLRGFRSVVFVPLMRGGVAIGSLNVTRREAGRISDHQIDLLKTFADQAVIAIENVRLFNETKEALERQTATAEILKVIASSPSDVQPVFDAILESATRLCDGHFGILGLYDGENYKYVAHRGSNQRFAQWVVDHGQYKPRPGGGIARMTAERGPIHIADVRNAPAYREGNPVTVALADIGGVRTYLSVPMLKEGHVIGGITIYRPEIRPFSEKQIDLVSTFANQAVIAIENVRLFNETRESLERQTATAEILKVIASSPSDVRPVFDAIAASARRLLDGHAALVARVSGDHLELEAFTPTNEAADAALRALFPSPITGKGHMGQAILSSAPVLVSDVENDERYSEAFRASARVRGVRSVVSVPMLREAEAIGVISVNRRVPGNFSEHQTNLLRTFADQAVIAIENVRLFNETKESLERQTATAEILKVIASSPSDVQPVFDAIVQSAARLFGRRGSLRTVETDGLRRRARSDASGQMGAETMAIDRNSLVGKAVLEGKAMQLADVRASDATPHAREHSHKWDYRANAAAPLVREGKVIGVITVTSPESGLLSDKQMALLTTFADQAVIAIENVRLFNETKEALEQQTATAEILKVISESPTDTQPVFDAIVQAGLRLFPDAAVLLGIPQGGKVRAAAVANSDAAAAKIMMSRFPIPFARGWMHAEAILDGQFINFSDAEREQEGRYGEGVKNFLSSGYRAITIAPMICGDSAIGAISVSRPRPGPLSEKQIALLRTFAAQAVIAIENVRIFKELEARTGALTRSVEQLTALGEVGRTISSSLDLETVLKTIVQRAVQLTGLDGGSIYEYDERSEEFQLRAAENLSEEIVEVLRTTPMRKGEGVIGHAVETGEPTEVPDMLDDSYQSPRRDTLIQAGYRALLVVPLRRDEHIIGALAVNRKAPGLFPHDVIELLKTFATQSALAIQNARLFREIADKGKQLEVASRHKSDFLASMSHELRTPLNAILGFNEMILGQVYGDVPQDMREPLEDIQKSGKHLLRLINNVLDLAKIEAGRMELALMDYSVHDTVESVRSTLRPLAAEKGLEFVASVPADLPLAYGDGGRITQCLMNLAGNSLKFTKAGKVEISVAEKGGKLTFRVADTGIGIPPDKIGSLFTEFKQTDATVASEYGGTGLGLSISKKFVEMHGGRIWVESALGKGSAFMFEIPLRIKTP